MFLKELVPVRRKTFIDVVPPSWPGIAAENNTNGAQFAN
jgi:hypothetical protein